jgi:fructose-specific phosphotransferase system IIC component
VKKSSITAKRTKEKMKWKLKVIKNSKKFLEAVIPGIAGGLVVWYAVTPRTIGEWIQNLFVGILSILVMLLLYMVTIHVLGKLEKTIKRELRKNENNRGD